MQVGWGTRALGATESDVPKTGFAAETGRGALEPHPPGVPADFFSEKGGHSLADEKEDTGSPYARDLDGLDRKVGGTGRSERGPEAFEVYHDYLPELQRSPDLEHGASRQKSVIRLI